MFHPFLAPKGVEDRSAVHPNLDLNELPETSYFKEKVQRKEEIWSAEDRVDGLKMSGVSRVCVDCQTTKTPLWRSGPRGPKTLCNACGIRYRKRRKAAAALGFQKEDKEKQGRRKHVGVPLKLKILGNEEEEAAVLLMALSCGSVYA
ncbi:GATA transcription factor 16 [Nymphaea thermarum]|nr:GATA transcription factor 16 [Nymphaea thermarum]